MSLSTTTAEVPPIWFGSKGLEPWTGSLSPEAPSLTESSWLRTSSVVPRLAPRNAAMPSKSLGTGAPSESFVPSGEMTRYWNPLGSSTMPPGSGRRVP